MSRIGKFAARVEQIAEPDRKNIAVLRKDQNWTLNQIVMKFQKQLQNSEI
jgi:hypothetical protein